MLFFKVKKRGLFLACIFVGFFCVGVSSVIAATRVWDFSTYSFTRSSNDIALELGVAQLAEWDLENISSDTGTSKDAEIMDVDGDGDNDIYVANDNASNTAQNKLWINQGGDQGGTEGTFSASDISGDTEDTQGVAYGDVDGDGDIDLYAVNEDAQNKLWINQGGDQGGTEGTFSASDISGDTGNSFDALMADFDGDNDIDIYVVNYNEQNKLWINQGGTQGGTEGTFSASDISGDNNTSHGAIQADVDRDGDLDIYVTMRGSGDQNKLWINQGGTQGGTEGTFSASDISGDTGEAYAPAAGDVDGDGDIDLYVAKRNSAQNKLWINQGGDQGGTEGTFSASDISGDTGNSFKPLIFDADGDTDLDIFVVNYNAQHKLWINQGEAQGGTEGTFSANDITGLDDPAFGAGHGDVDGDGDDDLYIPILDAQNKLLINKLDKDFVFISPQDSIYFSTDITAFSHALGDNHDGDVNYQISTDDGANWYYWNGSSWQVTTATDGTETSTVSEVNTNIGSLDSDGGDFLWRAYLSFDTGSISELDTIQFSFTDHSNAPIISDLSRYQTFQRDGNTLDLPLSGTYSGTCTSVEVSWNGGAFTTIDAAPSGGTWSGTASDLAEGQGAIIARCSNNTSGEYVIDNVGIGDVFVIAGQSNAEGRGLNYNRYTHNSLKSTAFDESDSWIDGHDPIDIGGTGGSPWPLLASQIMSDQSVPVAFVTTARGGTGIDQWDPDAGFWYSNMINQVNQSGVNNFAGVLFHQGENDVNSEDDSATRSGYNSRLDATASGIVEDIPGNPAFIVAQVGYQTSGGAQRDDLDAVRLAQSDAWDDNANVQPGPTLYDVGPHADGVHFGTDDDVQTLADRWWAAVDAAIYDGTKARGPQFSSAFENEDRDQIDVHFDNVQTSLTPASSISGFRVEDDGVSVSISSVERVDSDTVRVNLSSSLSGTATISLGSGNDQGNLYDASDLPAETFVDESVNSYDSTAPTTPVAPDLQAASDTGSSTTDNRTTDTTPTFDVVCSETGSTITLYVDGSSDTTAACSATGTRSITASALTAGTYSITYTETDISDNESEASSALSVLIGDDSILSTGGGGSSDLSVNIFSRIFSDSDTSDDENSSEEEDQETPPLCSLTQNLRQGARDGVFHAYAGGIAREVNLLQKTLNLVGFNAGIADGIFGNKTATALRQFQTQSGLLSDAHFGPRTRTQLLLACSNTDNNATPAETESETTDTQETESETCDAALTQNLRQGARDGVFHVYAGGIATQVARLQSTLNVMLAQQGRATQISTDGIFGAQTQTALQQLQTLLNETQNTNLDTDGILGPNTRRAVNEGCA
jgi:hypothetical protein